MATEVIHEHEHTGSNGVGLIVGVVLLIVALLFFWFIISNGTFSGFGSTSIQVPDRINVNLNQGQPR